MCRSSAKRPAPPPSLTSPHLTSIKGTHNLIRRKVTGGAGIMELTFLKGRDWLDIPLRR